MRWEEDRGTRPGAPGSANVRRTGDADRAGRRGRAIGIVGLIAVLGLVPTATSAHADAPCPPGAICGGIGGGGGGGGGGGSTPPTITASVSPAPNAAGWNTAPVDVTFTVTGAGSGTANGCGDTLSGSATGPFSGTYHVTSDTAGISFTCSATSFDGTQGSKTVTVKLDRAAPALQATLSPTVDGTGWYRGDVTVRWTCSDSLSGIAGSCPPNDTVTGEGYNLSRTASVSDVAGNTTSATSRSFSIDRTPPKSAISPAPPSAASVAHLVTSGELLVPNASVSGTATDNLSGVDTVRVTFTPPVGSPTTALALVYNCRAGSGTSEQCLWSANSPSADGVYQVTSQAIDSAGNVEPLGAGTTFVHAQDGFFSS